jgi:ABC-type multidrug transport system ATPase subunit
VRIDGILRCRQKVSIVLIPSFLISTNPVLPIYERSTLLDLLADRKLTGVWSGDIFSNYRPRSFWSSQESAYVLQDDCHIPSLTVEETLRYAAWTRLPESATPILREARVKTLMDIMGLAQLKDNLVGDSSMIGLSGGQMKRLSIAVELIPLPHLIFLDEPTSGLDSSFAFEVISSVRKLTDMRRTIVSTIHQPSPETFKLFHKVVLLTAGLVIYAGPTDDVISHFTRPQLGYRYNIAKNPAEYVVDICAGLVAPAGSEHPRSPDDLRSLYVKSSFYESPALSNDTKEVIAVNNDDAPSTASQYYMRQHATTRLTQFRMLVHRSFTSIRRDINDLLAQGLKNSIIGILIGVVFLNQGKVQLPTYVGGVPVAAVSNVNALLFFAMLYCLLSNLQAIPALVSKNVMYRRELQSYAYSASPYWLSQLLVAVPLLLFNHIVFTVIVFSMVGFSDEVGAFFYFFFALLIANVASFYIALFLASVTASSQLAFSIFPIIFLFFGMFSGFTINIASVPPLWTWAPYISYSRWVYQGLMVNQWTRYLTDDDTPGGGDGLTVLQSYNFANANMYNTFWIILLNILAIAILVYLAMLPERSRLSKVPVNKDLHIVVSEDEAVTASPMTIMMRLSGGKDIEQKAEDDMSSKTNDDYGEEDSPHNPSYYDNPMLNKTGNNDGSPLNLSRHGLGDSLLKRDTFTEKNPISNDSSSKSNASSSSTSRPNDDIEANNGNPGTEELSSKSTVDVAWYRNNTGEVQLSKGCRLVFRNIMYTVSIDPNAHKRHLRLFNEAAGNALNRKQILKGVSGRAHPGEMCALMGASGAGKSTLLDVLAARKTVGTIQGEILYNGSLQSNQHMKSSAYVMQDNVHIAQLTVLQTLSYAASLRLPQRTASKMRAHRVTKIMDMLGLHSCANSQVGGQRFRGISGGQMKRLSIGVEIVHMPDLIFLDEPTTGLDSSTSYEVMAAVRNLANQNRTVSVKKLSCVRLFLVGPIYRVIFAFQILCTIHQPSPDTYALFDKLLLLAEGRVIYFGPSKDVVSYFVNSPYQFPYVNGANPADFLSKFVVLISSLLKVIDVIDVLVTISCCGWFILVIWS